MFMLLESNLTRFKAPDGSENGKWIKMNLTHSSPGPFICKQLAYSVFVKNKNSKYKTLSMLADFRACCGRIVLHICIEPTRVVKASFTLIIMLL
jgi:hypothetical protein